MLPVTVMIWCCSEHQNQSCWECMPISCPACRACQTQMVSRSAYPACQAGRAKTGNETSARREIWDQSLATILDKIKWKSKSPFPQIKDEGARRTKTRHFPILDLGGSGGCGGGLGFPFILSKIVGQFWAARVWPHFFHAYEMLFLSANGPFNFVMPKYIKLRLSH